MGHHAVLVSARAACAPCQRMLPLQRLRVGPAERVSSRQRDYLLEQPRANRSYDRIADPKCEGILEKIHAGEQKPGEKDTFQRQIERIGTFNDKQSQSTERKTGDGRGPGDHSSEAG